MYHRNNRNTHQTEHPLRAEYKRASQALLLELNASFTRGGMLPSLAKREALQTHIDVLTSFESEHKIDALTIALLTQIDAEGASLMSDPVQHEARIIALQTAKNALLSLQQTEGVSS